VGTIVSIQTPPFQARRKLFYIHIQYRYVVNGQNHVGSRIRFELSRTYSPYEIEQFKAAHPPGSSVTVYYDPAQPTQSTLERRHGGVFFGLTAAPVMPGSISALCLIPGLTLLVEALRNVFNLR
jgi:hypothetical protein